jgi:5-carboxymethyl-2-hydroxymuconate isomerase
MIGPMQERPGKILAAGMNYRDHAAEAGLEVPERPVIFAIWPSSVIGPGEAIVIPSLSSEIDYEAELGVVNDVTARDLQFADGQWTRAKSLDTFSPTGPRVAPASEIPDPQALRIRCLVNGEALQDSSTSEMVFSVAELIAYISRGITLEPGDLIVTGTPAGVGFTRTPPVYLRSGDEVTVEIEGVGALTNPVRAEEGA